MKQTIDSSSNIRIDKLLQIKKALLKEKRIQIKSIIHDEL